MTLSGVYQSFLNRWRDYQSAWVISDTHFGDTEIAAGIPNRPSADELVKLINSKVGKKDVLIHLGDVGDLDYVRHLRGYKVLVMGNHDSGRTNYERRITQHIFDKVGFTDKEALEHMKLAYPNCRYTIDEGHQFQSPFEYWVVTADNCLFDEVYEGPVMLGEKLLLSHEPVSVSWAYNIHGHDHAGNHLHHNGMNVCIDASGMTVTPINLNKILKRGLSSEVESIHRTTINRATKRKQSSR